MWYVLFEILSDKIAAQLQINVTKYHYFVVVCLFVCLFVFHFTDTLNRGNSSNFT